MISFTEDSVKTKLKSSNPNIEEAPRDTFKDILDAIDRFVYFENSKK